MASTFFGLNIARSGMSTYNAWLNTTGHNIANVKTPGYSRQVVNQAATVPISYKTSYGMAGSGVEAVSITSERDIYYDNKYRNSNSVFGKYDTQTYYMRCIEDYFYPKDSNTGAMTNSLNKFFQLLSGLETDKISDPTARTEAVGYADTLTYYIREAANGLKNLQKDINIEIGATADKINSYAEQIAYLNEQITSLEVYGSRANDLRDQRANILDKLSELIDIDVMEKEPVGGMGHTQFVVTVGSAVLVDTFEYNTIKYETLDTTAKQNDITNMYSLKWSNGQDFGMHETGLGGKMQALFEMRDGNNGEVFKGDIQTVSKDQIVVQGSNEIANSLFKLDIPAANGVIAIGKSRYEYESFEVKTAVDADGNSVYTYTFHLKDELDATAQQSAKNVGKMQISDEVDFRGIPYYMSQLNEFARKFSYEFNKVQVAGYDLNGDLGKEMFVAIDKTTGEEMKFDTGAMHGLEDPRHGNLAGYTFSSTGPTNGIYSYYAMTALNTSVYSEIVGNGSLLACSNQPNEVSNSANLENMLKLEYDKTMFHQGQPASFLNVVTTTVGVDSKKVEGAAENADNIKSAIYLRRLSKSGVDEDEEGQNLIICQNLLNFQYKVLSVMDEVLDKLINGTAV